MIDIICNFCSTSFSVHSYRKKTAHFCSKDCYHNDQKKIAYHLKICSLCKKEFTPNRNTRQNKYCCRECGILGRRKYRIEGEQIQWKDRKKIRISKWRGTKICAYCEKRFNYTSKGIHQIFCSVICNIKSRAYEVDENFFNKINSESKAYFLGLIFSDGSISGQRLSIASNDQDLIRDCKKLIKSEVPIYQYKNSFMLIIGNRNIYNALRSLGVLERKSWKEYGLPSIPKTLMWHFLRGVFDGDGSFFIDDRNKWKYLCASFSCGSRKFLQEIERWLKNHGIKTQNIRFDGKPNNTGSWQLRIARKKAIKKFTDYLYKNASCLLDRKYKIVKNFYA